MFEKYTDPGLLYSVTHKSATDILSDTLELYLFDAWNIIEKKKDILLPLYIYLTGYFDREGNPIKILPISDIEKLSVNITAKENLALALLENCNFIDQHLQGTIKALPPQNIACLTAVCGELHAAVKSLFPFDYTFFFSTQKCQLQPAVQKYRDRRSNPLKHEIMTIMQEHINTAQKITNDAIWVELIRHCGETWSCCLNVEYAASGEQTIAFRGVCGKINRLNKSTFAKRMTGYRKEIRR